MMASPSFSYASPSEAHSSIASPAPSQILLKRIASPNHLVQPQYLESPRSVPIEYSQYHTPEHQFEYQEQPEIYVNEDPHMYDFGPNSVHVEQQFVPSQSPQISEPNNNMLYAVSHSLSRLIIVADPSATTTNTNARTLC